MFFRPLPQDIHLKTFKYRCSHTFDYNELEQFRKLIELKFTEGSLKIEDNYYKSNCFINSVPDSLLIQKEKRFWPGLRYYIPEFEKNEYINNNFIEVGLEIKEQKITNIYFIINKNLWYIFYDKNRNNKSNEIFPNYYASKR